MVLKITEVHRFTVQTKCKALQSGAIEEVLQNLASACQVLNTGVVLNISTKIQRTDLARGKYIITYHQPFGLYSYTEALHLRQS